MQQYIAQPAPLRDCKEEFHSYYLSTILHQLLYILKKVQVTVQS